jgi:hypothetical protein
MHGQPTSEPRRGYCPVGLVSAGREKPIAQPVDQSVEPVLDGDLALLRGCTVAGDNRREVSELRSAAQLIGGGRQRVEL